MSPSGQKRFPKLPKGLAEFEASLHDLQFAPELVERLALLPGAEFAHDLGTFRESMEAVKAAEQFAAAARKRARILADHIWVRSMKSWSIKQLQEATGYDDE